MSCELLRSVSIAAAAAAATASLSSIFVSFTATTHATNATITTTATGSPRRRHETATYHCQNSWPEPEGAGEP